MDQDLARLTPGAHLRAEIERLGLDQGTVAEATEVSRQTINNIVNDRQPISRAMAARLGRLTGHGSDYWLRASFPAASNPQLSDRSRHEPAEGAPYARATSVLVNHQIVRTIADGVVRIEPFSPKNVQLASIDLTLDEHIITSDGRPIDISGGQSFVLQGGETVNVITRESLDFPIDYIGRVGAMARMAKFGIITSHGFQVDPGFSGHLQFCLFNAGGRPFELRSGAPVVSLEIIPLASPPSVDARIAAEVQAAANRDDVRAHFTDGAAPVNEHVCSDLIRHYLRTQVQTAPYGGEIVARIRALGVEVFDHPKHKAIEGAVDLALGTLDDLRSHAQVEADHGDRYRIFFDDAATRLHLSADQVHWALVSMGLVKGTVARPVVTLWDGAEVILQVPRGSAKISLENFANQLHVEAADLLLILAGLQHYGRLSK